MSEETTPTETPTAGKPKPKLMLIAIVLLGGLVVGGGAGAFVAGPMLAKPAAHADAGDPDAADADAEGDTVSAQRGGKPPVLYSAENLVLNPAGSGGMRFLMVSAAFELKDAKVMEDMRARDIELKDVLNQVLGSRTVDELADVALREPLKDEIRNAIDARFGRGSVRNVYLPQFVIQ